MASGGGIFTKRGRCHPFWVDLHNCVKLSVYPQRDCTESYEDYLECLHQTKQKERVRRVHFEAAKIRQRAELEAAKHPSPVLTPPMGPDQKDTAA